MVSIVGSQAEQVNITIDAGFEFALDVPVEDVVDGVVTAADLTGWVARAVGKARLDSTTTLFDAAPVIDAGVVQVRLTAAETATFDWLTGMWELSVAGGTRELLLCQGTVTVQPTISG